MSTVQVFANCGGGSALLPFMPPQDIGDTDRTLVTMAGHSQALNVAMHASLLCPIQCSLSVR